MKYIYWGLGRQTGKTDIVIRCLAEEKPFIQLKTNFICKCIPRKINDTTIENKVYYLWSNNGKYEETLIRKNQYHVDNLFDETEVNPQISLNADETEDDKKNKLKKEKFIRSGNVYDKLPPLEKLVNDVNYIILSGSTILQENKVFKEFLSLENTKHIIPYRIIKDPISVINKINAYQEGDYFELYKNNKSKAFYFLDNFIKRQRTMEKLLIQNNINITYFDLDDLDYATTFGFNSYNKQQLSQINYKLDNSEIKRRYDLAYSIAQEYLDTRCLTDTRIRGAVIDGLEV